MIFGGLLSERSPCVVDWILSQRLPINSLYCLPPGLLECNRVCLAFRANKPICCLVAPLWRARSVALSMFLMPAVPWLFPQRFSIAYSSCLGVSARPRPLYEFQCNTCGLFEKLRALVGIAQPMACPTCNAIAKRVFTPPRVQLSSTFGLRDSISW